MVKLMYVLIIISFIFYILLISYYKRIIGIFGEHWVKEELSELSDDYKILNDVMIITKDGISHQIDHVVFSKYGIFVIETKQINGYITGNDYDKKWTVYSGKKKFYIYNPVHQNYGHIKALEEVLELSQDKFIPIVCISSRAKVKIKSNVVVLLAYLLPTIQKYDKVILDNVDDVYNKLLQVNIIDKSKRREHVKNTKKIRRINEIDSANKCPKCGGDLVKRTGKYGSFFGCSNYPQCHFIKK
jgi:hypothetical protein